MPTVIPNTGTDLARRIAATNGQILLDEIHTTRDNHRVFKGNYLVAPVIHRNVVGEAGMLALNSSSTRGCFAGDSCIRLDTGEMWVCFAGRGSTLDQWFNVGKADDILSLFGGFLIDGDLDDDWSGGTFLAPNSETIHGGFFGEVIFGGFF